MNPTPSNWFLAGSNPTAYETGIDKTSALPGRRSAYIASKIDTPEGFGTLMQVCKAHVYKGKRLQMTAYVKTKNIQQWAGLWFRVDGENNEILGFDNMHDRPITGNTDWQRWAIVLDIPDNAENLAFGVLVEGSGKAWISDVTFEVVGKDIPVTDTSKKIDIISPRPLNLDFKS